MTAATILHNSLKILTDESQDSLAGVKRQLEEIFQSPSFNSSNLEITRQTEHLLHKVDEISDLKVTSQEFHRISKEILQLRDSVDNEEIKNKLLSINQKTDFLRIRFETYADLISSINLIKTNSWDRPENGLKNLEGNLSTLYENLKNQLIGIKSIAKIVEYQGKYLSLNVSKTLEDFATALLQLNSKKTIKDKVSNLEYFTYENFIRHSTMAILWMLAKLTKSQQNEDLQSMQGNSGISLLGLKQSKK